MLHTDTRGLLHRRTARLLAGVFLLVGLALLPWGRYAFNPDGVEYVSIARKYLRGEFGDAVNGCWGPLFSWLLVPFLALQVPAVLAAKLLSLLIGAAALLALDQLARRSGLDRPGHAALLAAALPVLLCLAYAHVTPDLLLAAVLLAYLGVVLGPGYLASPRAALRVGFFGAMAYFAKGYGLPFWMSHVTACTLILHLRRPDARRRLWRNYALALTVFLVLAAPWVGLLSHKYGRFAWSTVGRYNYRRTGPEVTGHPGMAPGLRPPANATAVSAFEDFTDYDLPRWEPWRSAAGLRHELANVAGSARTVVALAWSWSLLALPILTAYPIWLYGRRRAPGAGLDMALLATLALFVAGYLPFRIAGRYLSLAWLLLLLMGVRMLSQWLGGRGVAAWARTAALAACVLALAVNPCRNLGLLFDPSRPYFGRHLVETAELLRDAGVRGRLASNSQYLRSFLLAFYLDSQYFGVTVPATPYGETVEQQLREHGIAFYLVWGRGPRLRHPVLRFEERPDLTVYDSREWGRW